MTRGERGAVVYLPDGGRVRIQPPSLDGPKSLMGLGDGFSAGVIDGLVYHGMSYAEAAAHAHATIGEVAKSEACNARRDRGHYIHTSYASTRPYRDKIRVQIMSENGGFTLHDCNTFIGAQRFITRHLKTLVG